MPYALSVALEDAKADAEKRFCVLIRIRSKVNPGTKAHADSEIRSYYRFPDSVYQEISPLLRRSAVGNVLVDHVSFVVQTGREAGLDRSA